MNLNKYLESEGHLTVSELRTLIGAKSDAQIRQWQHGYADRRPGPENCLSIERATNGEVTRQDLRPDDYWLIWPDLPAPKQAIAPATTTPEATETVADDAVVVAVLVAPIKPSVTTSAVQPRSGARRTGTPSPYNHSDIDRRDDLPGRREFNGGADKKPGGV
jgi:DNA-binding transcriptional regulator YdaS (Cro superfamily)